MYGETTNYQSTEEQEVTQDQLDQATLDAQEEPGVGDDSEQGADDSQVDERSKPKFSQEDFERRIRQMTAVERSRYEKKLARTLGVPKFDINDLLHYYQAGKAVSDAAGKSPQEVLAKLSAHARAQTGEQQGAAFVGGDPQVRQELMELKNLVLSQQESRTKESQEAEARNEYGSLYDDYQGDIEELAEDRGLSLVDAAAIVLRPHLKKHIEQTTRAKQQAKSRRSVVPGDDKPPKGQEGWRSQLNQEHLRIAAKAGISPEKYYEAGKKTGLFK